MTHAEVFVDTQDRLGEGPIWWKAEDALAWVDILDGEIHVADWDGNHLETMRMPEPVGCIFEQPDGSLVAGCRSGLRSVPDGRLILPLPPSRFPVRINDGKVDPQGRMVFGTMGYPDVEPGAGTLWRYDGNSLVALLSGLTISNGLDWIEGGRQLLFIDTPAQRIEAFDYGTEGAPLHPLGVWTDLSSSPGVPDGLAYSATHGTMVAMWDGGLVLQLLGKSITHSHPTGVQYPTSVLFHPSGDALLVTTAQGASCSARKTNPSGAVLRISIPS